MKLNCKPGQLAIVVKSYAGNEGKIVECVRIATQSELRSDNFEGRQGPVWIVRQKLLCTSGGYTNYVHDGRIRPLRDSDGEDETFTWAGKPEEVKV